MSHIWVPKFKILEGELSHKVGGMAGEFTLTRRKADTLDVVQQVGPFSNLITDYGLNLVGTTAGWAGCFVGTNSTPPSVSNPTLGSYLNHTSSTVEDGWPTSVTRGGSPDYWVTSSATYRFAAGAATGNITEVGMGYANNVPVAINHRLFSHALTVDGAGNPVTITVLADEILDVTYSLRYYPPLGPDVVQVVNISGVDYTFTTRLLNVNGNSVSRGPMRYNASSGPRFYTGTAAGTPPALAAITATNMLTQGADGPASSTQQPYVNTSKTISSVITAGLSEANLAYGLRGMTNHTWDGNNAVGLAGQVFQSTIAPAIPKNNTKVLTFGSSVSWDRHL